MRLTEDDRFILDKYTIWHNEWFGWCWECDPCGDNWTEGLVSQEQAIDSARHHDEEAHRAEAGR